MGILSLKASLLIMGLSGIVAQIILLRELLVTFLGNELTLGIILANWMIMEAPHKPCCHCLVLLQ